MAGPSSRWTTRKTGALPGGYAKMMRDEWDAAEVNIVVTTVHILGRPSPVMITNEMVTGMKAGSIAIDLAAEEDKGLGAGGTYGDFADGMGWGRREDGGRIY